MAESIMTGIGVISFSMALLFSGLKFLKDINKETRKHKIIKYTFKSN